MDDKRLWEKLDSIDTKLDSVSERLVRTETKQQSMAGQIKWLFSAVLAAISGAIGYIFDFFKGTH